MLTPKRILIIRLDRLGDVILSTPVLDALRRKFPHAFIAMMVRPACREVLEGNPHLNEVIVYEKEGAHRTIRGTIRFARALRRDAFDAALVLHPSNRSHWIPWLAGIPSRIGYDRKSAWLLTHRLPHRKQEGEQHEARYALDMLQVFGVTPPPAWSPGATHVTARTGRSEAGGGVIAVFIGGETLHYALPPSFAEALIGQVKTVCEAIDGWCLVTTSRRTPPSVERLLAEDLGTSPRCRLLLLAGRDSINGTMEGMLGCADVAVVTGESISMVSEACANGRAVVVVEPPLRDTHRTSPTKHQRFLRELVQDGYVQVVQLPNVGSAIERALKACATAKRLDNVAAIRDSVAHLL